MRLPDTLKPYLRKLSAPAVYELLVAMNLETTSIVLDGQFIFVRDWAVDDEVIWQLADQTRTILFWGGPPVKQGYYKGTLYTLVLDRIYTYLLTHSIQDLYRMVIPTRQKVFQW